MTDERAQAIKPQRSTLAEQAQRYLRTRIAAGVYHPGEQLPPLVRLAAELGISRLTLREALLGLEREGLILLKHGVGTFIAANFGYQLESGLERLESILELAARQGLQVRFDDLHVAEEPATQEIADLLALSPGAPLTTVCRVIMVDGMPVAYMRDLIPSSLLRSTEVGEGFNGSVLELLREKRDLRQSRAVANIVAINADDDLAGKLRVKPQQAIQLLEETLFDGEGMPVECSRNYFNPACIRFHVIRR
jgi:GntR family transcriptional regulator